MAKLWFAIALMSSLLLSAPVVEAKPSKKAPQPVEDIATVEAKLIDFIEDYLEDCNINATACRTKPVVQPREGKMVAHYFEMDLKSLKTEVYPSPTPEFTYIAQISYVEHIFESEGATKEEALAGKYKRVKSRKLTELPRYIKGKWHN